MFNFGILGGVYSGWALGSNDSANIFGTSVGSRAIKYTTAILLTSIFVILGSLLEGPQTMDTVSNLTKLSGWMPFIAAASAALTITFMTVVSIPASTSQAIIGALIGIGFANNNPSFNGLLKIVICWIGTPVGAALISFLLYHFLGYFFNKIKNIYVHDRVLKILIILSGCYGAYSLGANNVANTMGVFVGQPFLGLSMTKMQAAAIGGLSIALGTMTFSKKVMETVGKKITPMSPFGSFITMISMAITVHIYTLIGVPVSTSQAIVGTVVGVGIIKGLRAVSFKMVYLIGISWVLTPTLAAIISFLLMRGGAAIF